MTMKKFFYSVGILVLSSFFFASCQKEAEELILEDTYQEIVDPIEMVTFNFTAEKAGVATKTQAVVDEEAGKVSYEWTSEDVSNIKLFLVDGSSLTEVASPVITKESATRLKISATVPKADSYTFRAVLAREFYSKGQPMVSKYQSPKTNNFDPKGDILFSDDLDVTTDGTSTGELLLTFNRKVAVSEMTLKNLGVGEKISKVKITSEADGLVGYYDGSDIVDLSDEIVLTYANEVVPDGGQFKVFFTSAPISNKTITVTVTTNTKTYTKVFARPISFALGSYLQFGVALEEGVTPMDTWDLVTSSSDNLADGDVVYIASFGGEYGMGAQSSNLRTAIAATPISEGLQITSNPSFQEVVLEEDGDNFYLRVGSNQYLYASSNDKNNIGTSDKSTVGDNGKFAITIASDGNAKVQAQGSNARNVIKYNYNNGNPRFSCYADNSTEPELALYRKTSADATVWNLKSLAVTTNPSKMSYYTGDAFNHDGMVVAATFEDNAGEKDDKVINIDNNELTVSPMFLSEGDTKVTLSYKNLSVDVTGLTVSKINYATLYTSNLSISGGSAVNITINSTNYSGRKLGSSGKGGSCSVDVPAGTTVLHVHAAAWNGKSPTLKITPEEKVSSTNPVSLTADTNVSGSGTTYNLASQAKAATDYYKTFTLTGITTSTTITITSVSERAVIWGVNAQ